MAADIGATVRFQIYKGWSQVNDDRSVADVFRDLQAGGVEIDIHIGLDALLLMLRQDFSRAVMQVRLLRPAVPLGLAPDSWFPNRSLLEMQQEARVITLSVKRGLLAVERCVQEGFRGRLVLCHTPLPLVDARGRPKNYFLTYRSGDGHPRITVSSTGQLQFRNVFACRSV